MIPTITHRHTHSSLYPCLILTYELDTSEQTPRSQPHNYEGQAFHISRPNSKVVFKMEPTIRPASHCYTKIYSWFNLFFGSVSLIAEHWQRRHSPTHKGTFSLVADWLGKVWCLVLPFDTYSDCVAYAGMSCKQLLWWSRARCALFLKLAACMPFCMLSRSLKSALLEEGDYITWVDLGLFLESWANV